MSNIEPNENLQYGRGKHLTKEKTSWQAECGKAVLRSESRRGEEQRAQSIKQ
jgi:hypothetical protein